MVNYGITGSLTFRIAAVIISVTCIFYMSVMQSGKKLRKSLYLNMVYVVAIDALAGILIQLVIASQGLTDGVKYVVVYICRLVYYMTHFTLAPIFLFYILLVAGTYYRYSASFKVLMLSPFFGLAAATLFNPFTNFTFILDRDFTLHRQQGVYLAYVISAIYLIYCMYLLITCWKTLHGVKLTAMIYFLSLVIIGVMVQMIAPDLVVELMCEAVGLMGIMIMLEDESSRQDNLTGTLNRSALLEDLRDYFLLKHEFRTLCVRITNQEVYRKIMGYNTYNDLERAIGEYLVAEFPKYQVYRSGMDSFFVVCPDTDRDTAERMAYVVERRFRENWEVGAESFLINAVVLIGTSPMQFERVDDVFMLSDSPLEQSETCILTEDDLGFMFRRAKVEKAISRGMDEAGFSVSYRMIYDMKGTTLRAASAGLRLIDRELGEIAPEEFLPVAEQSGVMNKLEKIIVESVCANVQRLAEKGISPDFVLIPIMSGQLISTNLLEMVITAVRKYRVDPKILAFDISKAVASESPDLKDYLNRNYENDGVMIFLRDNENDFLRILSRSAGRFDGAVLDLHPLMEEGNRKQAEIILTTRINLLKELGKKIVVSGVDTENEYDLVSGYQVDYVTGNFLSDQQTDNEMENAFVKQMKKE